MGNTPSQHTTGTDSDIADAFSPQSSNSSSHTPSTAARQAIHPLLSASSPLKTAPLSSSSRIMAHNDNFTQHVENSASTQDVTMSGTGQSKVNLTTATSMMSIDGEGLQTETITQTKESEPQAPPRRRSTLILTDDPDYEKLKLSKMNDSASHDATPTDDSASQLDKTDTPPAQGTPVPENTVPVEIQWFQGGENVFITGSFTGWRKMIKLVKDEGEENKFSIKLRLPVGTHRFRFIVDNELRFSDYLPTATDQMGNFVNYIEIQSPESSQVLGDETQQQSQTQSQLSQQPSHAANETDEPHKPTAKDSNLGLTNDDDDMGNGYVRFHDIQPLTQKLNYIRDIPAIFTDPSVMEQYYVTLDNNQNQNQSWLTPPQLPPHLESVILNNYSNADKSNSSGALPIPNHVVLNHLATTSIKHNTLAVASVVRYKRKYVTQVLYAPLQ